MEYSFYVVVCSFLHGFPLSARSSFITRQSVISNESLRIFTNPHTARRVRWFSLVDLAIILFDLYPNTETSFDHSPLFTRSWTNHFWSRRNNFNISFRLFWDRFFVPEKSTLPKNVIFSNVSARQTKTMRISGNNGESRVAYNSATFPISTQTRHIFHGMQKRPAALACRVRRVAGCGFPGARNEDCKGFWPNSRGSRSRSLC